MVRSKHRKHRLVVDMTTSQPLTAREAQAALSVVLDRVDLNARPIWPHRVSNYVDKLVVRSYDPCLSA